MGMKLAPNIQDKVSLDVPKWELFCQFKIPITVLVSFETSWIVMFMAVYGSEVCQVMIMWLYMNMKGCTLGRDG